MCRNYFTRFFSSGENCAGILEHSVGAKNRLGIGCRTGSPEPVFVNVYGAQELIPPGWNRFLGSYKGLQSRAQAT
jgi:hypothetical protein